MAEEILAKQGYKFTEEFFNQFPEKGWVYKDGAVGEREVSYSFFPNTTRTVKITVEKLVEKAALTYKFNKIVDGVEIPAAQEVVKGTEVALAKIDPEVTEKYSFLGYDTDGDGKVDAQPGDMITVNEDMTVTAIWEGNYADIAFTFHTEEYLDFKDWKWNHKLVASLEGYDAIVKDEAGNVLQKTKVENGKISFNNLPKGKYTFELVVPANMEIVKIVDGNFSSVDNIKEFEGNVIELPFINYNMSMERGLYVQVEEVILPTITINAEELMEGATKVPVKATDVKKGDVIKILVDGQEATNYVLPWDGVTLTRTIELTEALKPGQKVVAIVERAGKEVARSQELVVQKLPTITINAEELMEAAKEFPVKATDAKKGDSIKILVDGEEAANYVLPWDGVTLTRTIELTEALKPGQKVVAIIERFGKEVARSEEVVVKEIKTIAIFEFVDVSGNVIEGSERVEFNAKNILSNCEAKLQKLFFENHIPANYELVNDTFNEVIKEGETKTFQIPVRLKDTKVVVSFRKVVGEEQYMSLDETFTADYNSEEHKADFTRLADGRLSYTLPKDRIPEGYKLHVSYLTGSATKVMDEYTTEYMLVTVVLVKKLAVKFPTTVKLDDWTAIVKDENGLVLNLEIERDYVNHRLLIVDVPAGKITYTLIPVKK